jgi:SAM-dependent methyltransferase
MWMRRRLPASPVETARQGGSRRRTPIPEAPSLAEVEGLLHEIYVGVAGARLRADEKRKAIEVRAVLGHAAVLLRGLRRQVQIVDLACGNSYLAFGLARLLLPRIGLAASILALDSDPRLMAKCEALAGAMGLRQIRFRAAAIAGAELPTRADLVLALHACGGATDQAIARIIDTRARRFCVVPCCHRRQPRSYEAIGFPRQGLLRGRLHDLVVDARRALRLEQAGYEVEAVEFVPSKVTPHNLMLRGRHIGPTGRTVHSGEALRRLEVTFGCG